MLFSTAVPQKAVLDIENCLLCGKCEKACPVEAIDFTQVAQEFTVQAETILLATGYELTPTDAKKEYGAGTLPNVVNGLVVERQHDLVVLSVGMVSAYDPRQIYGVPIDGDDRFVHTPAPNLSASVTDRPGIFVTGTAAGPMDIVDSIVLAGAAAETAAYLEAQDGHIPSNGRPAGVKKEAELAYV